jgi:hypothetical protein
MKYLIVTLVSPIFVVFNLIGVLYALCAIGFMNGYIKTLKLTSEAQEK